MKRSTKEAKAKKTPASATSIVSAQNARTRFGQIMHRASSQNERFIVDRRGEPSVVIMSVSDYMSVFAPEPAWLAKARAQSARNGTDKLTMGEIDKIVADVRRSGRRRSADQAS